MEKGKFIVVEGISGSGKGTQIFTIAQYLREKDIYADVLLTREPTNSQYGLEARRLRRQHKDAGEKPEDHAQEYLDLFLKDRLDHLYRTVNPSLEQGIHVVCDRYMFSTIVLQQCDTLPASQIVHLHEQAGVSIPDLTLIYDLPAEEALRRIEARNVERGLSETLERLQRGREGYSALPSLCKSYNLVVVYAIGNSNEVFQKSKSSIDKLFQK